MQSLIIVLLLEGATNWRLSLLFHQLSGHPTPTPEMMSVFPNHQLFNIPVLAERAWRILVGALLYLSVFVYPEALWFFPWFMGFAILGAGISGVCPMLFSLHYIGFK